MLQRFNLGTVAFVISMVMSALLAAPFAHFVSETPNGVDLAFAVSNVERPLDQEEFSRALEQFSEETGVGVALESTGIRVAEGESHLYVVRGSDLYESWLAFSPRSFNPRKTYLVKPFSSYETTAPGRGYYYLDSGPLNAEEALTQFQHLLDEFGLGGSSFSINPILLLDLDVVPVLLVTLLLTFTLGGLQVVVGRKRLAVNRLLGRNFIQIAKDELLLGWKLLLPVAVVITALGAASLFVYNRFHGLGVYLKCLFPILTMLVSATVLGYVLVNLLFRAVPLLGAIKGDMPSKYLTLSVYVVRGMALILAINLASVTVGAVSVYARLQDEGEDWRPYSGLMSAYLASSAEDASAELANQLRNLDRSGDLVLANQMWNIPLHGTSSDRPIVLMNHTAAELNGLGWLGDQQNVVVAHSSDAGSETVNWAKEGVGAEEQIYLEEHMGSNATTEITVKEVPAGTQVFTFATSFGGYSPPSTVTDPVLVVLPPGLLPLGDRNVIANLSQSTLLLGSEQVAVDLAISRAGLINIAGYEPTMNRWLATKQRIESGVRSNIAALITAFFLTTFTVVSGVWIYQVRHRRQLRVRYLVGQSVFRGRITILCLEGVFLMAVPFWLVWRQLSLKEMIHSGTARLMELSETIALTETLASVALMVAGLWTATALLAMFVGYHSLSKESLS